MRYGMRRRSLLAPAGAVPNTVDQRPRHREIRKRDEHIGRLETFYLVEPVEQPVVQHFELPRKAMADMDLDARIGDLAGLRRGVVFVERENAVLHAREPRRSRIFLEEFALARCRALRQLVQHV